METDEMTELVRGTWAAYPQLLSQWTNSPRTIPLEEMRDTVRKFDDWLDQVRAKAWNEGHSWGWDDARQRASTELDIGESHEWVLCTPNPYRTRTQKKEREYPMNKHLSIEDLKEIRECLIEAEKYYEEFGYVNYDGLIEEVLAGASRLLVEVERMRQGRESLPNRHAGEERGER